MGVTQKLAGNCADLTYNDLPDAVVHQTKRCIIDWLGVGLAASQQETTQILRDHILKMGGNPQAYILGSDQYVSAEQAALINGTMSHVHDFDDTHLDTVIHPSSPVIPAAAALSQWRGASGEQSILAVATGIEAALRIGMSVCPAHYDLGWHVTGTAGVFGAAVAGCKIEKHSPDKIAAAIGLAATQSSGLREFFGTMCKPYLPGHAASGGLRAALLAGMGFTSSDRALEAPRGWASVLSPESRMDVIAKDWGTTFELLRVAFKPYPSGVVTHPVIDAILQIEEDLGPDPEDVTSILLEVHPLVLELTGKKSPGTGLEGKFSIYHCVATGLIRGQVGVREFTDEAVGDPQVVRLREKVSAEISNALQPEEAIAHIHCSDTSHTVHIRHARGSVNNPLSDSELEDKFLGLVAPELGKRRAGRLLELVWDLENHDFAELLGAAAGID